MKKLLLVSLLAALCAPAFAEGTCPCQDGAENCRCKAAKEARVKPGPRHGDKEARRDEFKKARKEHKAKMRATEEKAEKLVEEYKKLKPGKKKDAKKAEIAAFVASIREEQLKFKEEQLSKFKDRLARMEAGLARQKTAEDKQAWVEHKTNDLINDDGDLDALFDEREMGPAPKGHPMPGPNLAPDGRADGELPPPPMPEPPAAR